MKKANIMDSDIKRLRERYEQLDDDEIHRLVMYEVRDLRKEAVQVLAEEIIKRKLPKKLHEIIAIHLQGIESPIIKEIIEKIQKSPCPICGQRGRNLNMAIVKKQIAVIFFSIIENKVVVGCPPCVSEIAKRANLCNYFLGWWTISMGPFRNFSYIISNHKVMKLSEHDEMSEDFKLLIERNIGVLLQTDVNDGLIHKIVSDPEILRTMAYRKDGLVDRF